MRPLSADARGRSPTRSADSRAAGDVTDHLAQRSGGDPFFLEEALRDLVERGRPREERRQVEMAVTEDELAVPPSSRARCRRGSTASIRRHARCSPRRRDRQDIRASAPREARPARAAPAGAHRPAASRPIVEVRRRPNPECRFRHGLVQEVAYASLVEPTRRKLHKRVGEALEEIHRESPEESFGLLARHFSEADVPDKAVEYLLKAGDRARSSTRIRKPSSTTAERGAFLGRSGTRARARHALQDGLHLPPRVRLRERGGDVRRGVLVPGRRGARLAPTEHLSTAVRSPTPSSPARVLDRGPEVAEQLFEGLLMIDAELSPPVHGDDMRVSATGSRTSSACARTCAGATASR